MKNPFPWIVAVVVVLLWAAYESYPPTNRTLLSQFERDAENTQDPTFKSILATARELEAKGASNGFANLLAAAGTNSLERFFPHVEVPAGKDTNRVILNDLQRKSLGQLKLGLDLQGGMSFIVRMKTDQLKDQADMERALDQAVEILRRRVDRYGVAEPTIQRLGTDSIEIQMPGLTDAEKEAVADTIKKAARLEFRMVHEDSFRLIQEGLVPPGYELLTEVRKDPKSGQARTEPLLVKKKPEGGLDGSFILRAAPVPEPVTGQPQIEFEFNMDGARIFGDLTRKYLPRSTPQGGMVHSRMAIVLDGVLVSAPQINEEIPNGRGVIHGNFDMKEATEVANALVNPLQAPLEIIEESSVAATLGADSIQSGVKATVIGTLFVVGFMVVYYLLAGVIANFALMLNIFILLGVMCALDSTLTLPGIAGIVLTAGMAVDANVLIYERVREELQAGKSLRGALTAGYAKAFWTIFDSNLTTLISAVIMIWLGTGSVQGFGVTLAIGLCVSMFTALVVTRLIFDFLLSRGMTNLRMMSLVGETKFDFMKLAVPAFVLSWSLILIGIGYGVYRGKDVLGVDFAGGSQVTFSYAKAAPISEIRDAAKRLGVDDATIVPKAAPGGGLPTVQIIVPFDKGEKIQKELGQQLSSYGFQFKQLERKGPSVGEEIQLSALKSVMLALFGILVYVAFRYEFSFSIGAVIAIIHDVLMTMGWFFLTDRQLSGPMVAAILTIIGFSINDTIVIFDRIREDLKLGVKGSFRELLNLAINQTLSRTIITSGTVLLATLSLYVFGGSVINDFAFTFLVGILTGTYSTIYIASAVVLWWHKGQRPVIGTPAAPVAPQIEQPARA
ncbi:MAG: protein translocase subunit SecD [Verrucomicrobiales bacterium]|nr:protein translocase subunit SecD [Verrucomicrobiales bacterium]